VAGGTWLGLDVSNKDVSMDGQPSAAVFAQETYSDDEIKNSLRWIALTNYIDASEEEMHNKSSRGSLVKHFLDMDATRSTSSAKLFAMDLCKRADEYNGFNVLMADETGVYYCTNRGQYPSTTAATPTDESSFYGPLPSGIYGLSNGLLDSPWPKVQRGKEKLAKLCAETLAMRSEFHESLMNLLRDEWKPINDPLPDKNRSSIFVSEFDFNGRRYGTRSSTTILVEKNDGRVSVLERTWDAYDNRWFELVPKTLCLKICCSNT
jgi:uncharacterized protein with NRDE domain